MARRGLTDYAGPTARLTLVRAAQLGPRYVLQPKHDGAYARVHLDRRGRVERVLARSGAEFPRALTAHLLGAFVGWPDSVLVAEIEACTEAGNRAAATHGHRLLHVFDCLRSGGRYIAREPYRVRRDELWRMQSEVVNLGCALPWATDARGNAHDLASGRFVEATPTDWRLAPIVPQLPAARFDEAWSTWGPDAGGEGLVAVNLEAPVGARSSKAKVKLTDELDCTVVAVGQGAVRVVYRGNAFTLSARGDHQVLIGDVVSVACDGWHESSVTPRFARLVRRRPDLRATPPA